MKQGRKVAAGLMAVLICIGLTACGAATNAAQDGGSKPKAEADIYYYTGDTAAGAVFDSPEYVVKEESQSVQNGVYQRDDVKLIRRAWLTVQTTEFDHAVAELDTIVSELGGYFESAELYSGSYYDRDRNRSADYTIRIPAEKYDTFMGQVGGIGYLTRKNESSEDVGESYHDIESRLKTQRTKQERLLDLLKKADSMEDIIALESALTDVEYQIEQYTTDLNRYDGLIGLSTFHVTLNEVVKVIDEPGVRDGLLRRMGAGIASSANALVDGVQDVLVWLAYNLFGILLVAAVGTAGAVVGVKTIRRRKVRKAEAEEEQDK